MANDVSDDTTHDDLPLDERLKRAEEPIDYSPSSGAVGSNEKIFDATSSPDYKEAANQTKWSDEDTDNETIERFDEEMEKWDWLKRLNQGGEVNNRQAENRSRGRHNDFRMLVDKVTDITDHEQNWLYERSVDLCNRLTQQRDDGLRFGSTPVEVTEIAILTQAARSLVDVDEYDDLDMANGLHNVALDGTQIEHFCTIWPPKQTDTTIESVRYTRQRIRHSLTEQKDI